MPTQAALFGDAGDRCSVAISNSYDTCGTITRSNIAYATPSGLLDIFKDSDDYRDMQSMMTSNMELKACGLKTYGLYDWLMSSARPVGALVNQKKIQGTDSIMEPFILATQKSIINSDHWAVIRGWTKSEYEDAVVGGTESAEYPLSSTNTGVLTYGMKSDGSGEPVGYVLRLAHRDGLDASAAWFVPGATLHVFGRKTDGTAQRAAYVIAASAPNLAFGSTLVNQYTDVAVTLMTGGVAGVDSPGNAADSGTGIAVIGVNNVSDYESWCHNRPALNPNRVVPFWTQTSRYTLCVDEFYKEWFAKLTANNPYFARFGDVTLAERNRQLGSMWQKEWMNSFFWGKRISSNQSLANWTSLGTQFAHFDSTFSGVAKTDGLTTGTVVSRKANAVGVYDQLYACGRVKDLKGQKLNLAELFNELYTLYRTRSNSGRPADSIDVYTDSKTASLIQIAMVKYYGARTQIDGSTSGMRINYEVKDGKIDKLGFRVRSYELLYPQGVTLNIITDNFFDDFVSATSTEQTAVVDGIANPPDASAATDRISSTGRFLMILDLGGGIYPGIVGSNRKVHTVGALEDLAKIDTGYGCVMRSPTKEITLNSVTWTAVVECPDDNLIIENFTDDEPSVVEHSTDYTSGSAATAQTGSTTDLLEGTNN
jgi:hypothetical protein